MVPVHDRRSGRSQVAATSSPAAFFVNAKSALGATLPDSAPP
jgi:hypothetical protein